MTAVVNLLLAAAMLGFTGAAGYFFINKMTDLCVFEKEEKKEADVCDVVIFGRGEFAGECERYLNSRGIFCIRIEEMERLRQEHVKRAGYVVALDSSDYQNLVACGVLKGCCHSRYSLALCNDGGNRKIYLENKIRILDSASLSGERVYQMVKENRNAS